MNRDVLRTQQPDNGSTQTEEELQAEIDALQQQIDELKKRAAGCRERCG